MRAKGGAPAQTLDAHHFQGQKNCRMRKLIVTIGIVGAWILPGGSMPAMHLLHTRRIMRCA